MCAVATPENPDCAPAAALAVGTEMPADKPAGPPLVIRNDTVLSVHDFSLTIDRRVSAGS
jgi:hypothetical protein